MSKAVVVAFTEASSIPRRSVRCCATALLALPGMCTIHANSAREAVVKLCTLPLLAGENVSHAFVVPTVAASVDLVIHVGSDAAGNRRVREIAGVPGRVEGHVLEISDIFVTRDDRLCRADGFPPHAERFSRAGYDLPRLLPAPALAGSD